jgi:hypothetical protein
MRRRFAVVTETDPCRPMSVDRISVRIATPEVDSGSYRVRAVCPARTTQTTENLFGTEFDAGDLEPRPAVSTISHANAPAVVLRHLGNDSQSEAGSVCLG